VAHWLVKQEPSSYSYARLVADGRTRWDGVHNAQALIHLRAMAVGDEAIFYHSGEERSCVGILRIVTAAVRDVADPRPSWFVEVEPVQPLARPIPLAEIRADPAFRGIDLLRNSRLSVLPLPEAAWSRLIALSDRAGPASATAGRKGPARGRARPRRATGARRRR
jgi:predicted RNA-binding protein with PUA-like domain